MLDINDLQEITGKTRDAINKIMARATFKTQFPKPHRGKRQSYTRENAIELAFISALLDHGATTELAAARTQEWMNHLSVAPERLPSIYVYSDKEGVMGGQAYGGADVTVLHLLHAHADQIRSGWVGDPKTEQPEKPASGLHILNLHEIVRTIDAKIAEKRRMRK